MSTDRGVVLRNHIMGVLATACEGGFNYASIGKLADDITLSVIEGDRKWYEDNCCEQIFGIACEEDVAQ